MDNDNGNSSEKEQEHKNRQRMIDTMIPAGLTGQIRDKARDALMTATVILGMSRMDILDRIQELAKENGLTPQSARVWLLFDKEIQDRAKTVGREVGDKGSARSLSKGLGYSRNDLGTLGLGAAFRREVTGTGIGSGAADDMRRELNREAGHHGDSLQGRHGAFSYDQLMDGWGTGGDSQGAEAIGLDGQDGDDGLDMEIEGEIGSDSAKMNFDAHERLPGASVMTPDDLGEVQLVGAARRSESGHVVDGQDLFQAGKGGVSGGWYKNASARNPRREAAMERAEAHVAQLNRKMGGFRGTDEEFAAFAKEHPGLDKNQLRLLRKGLSHKDYLGWRVYMENGDLLGNRGKSDGRISTVTRACLFLASEDSARRFQNSLREKIRLFSLLPDPGMEKVSLDHAIRMGKPLERLVEEHKARVEESARIKNRGKSGKNRDEPGLER
ncbi:hypothetical protein [Acidithiobacillus sp.]|uniref:hypothetical protein n=1 Tax=Acidithiobacillus sp. TaxID=1872118 RepID=UPI003CFCB609